MEEIFKTKYEYCHVDAVKIVFSKSHKFKDLITDYTKTIQNFFKILMVFLIFTPIFSILSVVFYYQGNYGISILSGAFALFFLLMAFYLLLFISGSPVIYKDKIVKVTFKKILLFKVIEIKYRDFGRIKNRDIIQSNDQLDIDMALEILLNDKLIGNKIRCNGKQVNQLSRK